LVNPVAQFDRVKRPGILGYVQEDMVGRVDAVKNVHGLPLAGVGVEPVLGRQGRFGRNPGQDAAGAAMVRELVAYGVDASGLRLFEGCRSSQSTVIVDARGERLIVSYWGDAPGDAGWLPLADVARAGAVLADVRWPEGALALFAAARRANVPSVPPCPRPKLPRQRR